MINLLRQAWASMAWATKVVLVAIAGLTVLALAMKLAADHLAP